ncbi:transcription factor Adf-1-like isoform X6 [Leptidea sinapis]|nr:transcription factor Adf-1-like isoform X6 [Leptidea sinapis]
MDNYLEYHLMGTVSQVRMKPGCIPTKFECLSDSKIETSIPIKRPNILKKQRKILIEECQRDSQKESTKHLLDNSSESPVSDCKKRWKSLRDQYNKKKKADPLCSNWEYMNLLSFISDPVEKRDTPCTNDGQQSEEQSTDEEQSDDQFDELTVEKIPQNDPPNSAESSTQKRRATTRNPLEPIAKILAKRDAQRSILFEKMLSKVNEIKTPTQKFFESMADVVDKFPPNLQAEVRLKVCQVVTEIELKHQIQPSTEAHHFNHHMQQSLDEQTEIHLNNHVEVSMDPEVTHFVKMEPMPSDESNGC